MTKSDPDGKEITMASFALIKELSEKRTKIGNGFLDLIVIGSDKKNTLQKYGDLTITVSLKQTTLLRLNIQ